MANPVFSKGAAFNGGAAQQQAYQYQQQGYEQPYAPGYQQPSAPQGGVMTLDDVLAKTAITMLVLFATASLSFLYLPLALLLPALIGAGIVGLITVILVSTRRQIPVAGVLFYAAVEGVFIGAFSKFFEMQYPGIVFTAVLATFVAAGATLAAYKFFNIRVTPKFRKFVMIATLSLAGVLLVNFILSLTGIDLGLRDTGSQAGMLSIIVSVLAVGLAVFNLIVDFDYVERGIASGAPARESWRAAFGFTVTMVWLYIEILRILSYFRD